MELERRGRVRRSHARSNWKQEDLDACARQAVWSACLPDGSRVRRESHARFCERPVVKSRRPTHPHVWGASRNGKNVVRQVTAKDRYARALASVSEWCRDNRGLSVAAQHVHLSKMVRGHFAYYAITGNARRIRWYLHQVERIWKKWLSRRGGGNFLWTRLRAFLDRHPLPRAKIIHKY